MLGKHTAICFLLATGLAGCSLADDGSDSPSAVEPSPDLALESRVLAVVCDNDRPDTQEQLVQLARPAEAKSARVGPMEARVSKCLIGSLDICGGRPLRPGIL